MGSFSLKRMFKMIWISIVSLIGVIAIATTLFLYLSPQFGASPDEQARSEYQQFDNYQEGKFKNYLETYVMKNADLSSVTGYFTKGNKVPDWSLPVKILDHDYFTSYKEPATRLTWFGHSALLLEMNCKKIFIDPMLTDVPAPHPWLGTPRFNDTLPMSIAQLPQLDAVIISHDHYDHLDYESIRKLDARTAHYYVPLGIKAHLESWNVDPGKITELNWWQEVLFDDIKLVATPARHFSGRGITDRDKSLWCSWIIDNGRERLFYGGDSGYDSSFKKIGEQYGPFDLAMLESGQYDKQWPDIHMQPEETVQAAIDLNAQLLLPIHWGSFKLGLHEWKEPIERVTAAAGKNNVPITTPVIGESIVIGATFPQSQWWVKK